MNLGGFLGGALTSGDVWGALGNAWDNLSGQAGARGASEAQVRAAQLGIDEQRRQFDITQGLYKPYIEAGNLGLTEYLNLLGLGEGQAGNIYSNLANDPVYQDLIAQSEDALLQNAAATGGTRGGNVQGILAQLRPGMLNQFLQDRLAQYSNLMTFGQNSAANQAAQGQAVSNQIAGLYGEQGAANAGYQLFKSSLNRDLLNAGISGGKQALSMLGGGA